MTVRPDTEPPVEQRLDLLGREIRPRFADILIEIDVQGFGEAVQAISVRTGWRETEPAGSRNHFLPPAEGIPLFEGLPSPDSSFRLEPVEENAERVVMCQTAAVEKRSIEEKRRGNTGTLQDRRDDVVHLPESVIKRQVEAGTAQCPCSVQCIDDIPERYWFEVTEKKFQVSCELCDGSEPIQMADMRHQSVAYHVVVRNHKRHAGERAYPIPWESYAAALRQEVPRHCFGQADRSPGDSREIK